MARISQYRKKVAGWSPSFLLIGIAAFVFWKPLRGLLNSPLLFGKNAGDVTTDQIEKDTAAIAKPVVSRMSFSIHAASAIAAQLYAGFHPSSWMSADMDGTDENAVRAAFQRINTSDDMRAVYHAFGVRVYQKGWVIETKKDLIGFVQQELSGSDLRFAQSKLNLL